MDRLDEWVDKLSSILFLIVVSFGIILALICGVAGTLALWQHVF